MKTCIILLRLLVFTSFTHCLYAQSAEADAREYFDSVRAGAHAAIPDFHHANVADVLKPYLSDTTEAVRIKARELLFTVASASKSPTIRSKAIEHLLAATKRNDVTTTGIIIPMIKAFEKRAFTDSARMHVRRLVKNEGPYLMEWMKIAGFLQLKDLDNHIRPYSQPGNPQSVRWSALLSLSRMGDSRAAVEVLARVKKLGVNDDVVYRIFPDLIYTRDPTVIGYMVDVLHQDANQCLSADVERETTIPCGYRVMEQLAPVIEGFPLTLDESGDLDVDDYASALHAVRNWFVTHKNYSLRNDKY